LEFIANAHRETSPYAGTSFLIEDVACPVDKLVAMTEDLVAMFNKFGYKDASCFGHALEGSTSCSPRCLLRNIPWLSAPPCRLGLLSTWPSVR